MLDRIDTGSLDVSAQRRAELKALFPSAFTETRDEKGVLRESVDFEKLKAELGTFSDVFENRRERYGMDWPGKKDCLKVIQQPSHATLKPCREESVEFDSTENLFIEGDNLEVLKLLQKSYYGKVKMIYIDPPYNTGKEFIYPDNYGELLGTYLAYAGLSDSEGKKFATNTPTEGRFHTKWLNMMYSRLYLARNLLREDGVLFVSIGSEELSPLLSLMNELLGEECLKNIIVVRRGVKNVQAQFETLDALNRGHEYVLFYSKSPTFRFEKLLVPPQFTDDEDCEGSWNNHWRGTNRPSMRYELFGIRPEAGQWRWSESRSLRAINNWQRLTSQVGANPTQQAIDEWVKATDEKTGQKTDLLRLSATGKPEHYIRPSDGMLASDLWFDLKPNGGSQLKKCMGVKYFDTPKSIDLIKRLLELAGSDDAIVLDFFAGSATTAHAVLHLNAQDGGNRKFVCVQLPEPCNEASEAFKAGFRTIADIGKERIRRVIQKHSEKKQLLWEHIKVLDPDLAAECDEQNVSSEPESKPGCERSDGFRVLKLDRSNFRQWPELKPDTPSEQIVEQLELHVDHVDSKASPEELLFEVLIKAGLSPASKIETVELAGLPVFSVDAGRVLICLAETVTQELVDAVAKAEPDQFLCLDRAFHGNDQLRANASQTFDARQNTKPNASPIVFRTI